MKALKRLKKTDTVAEGWLQIVWGEVYIPNVPDSGNDYMTVETIRDMAYRFMRTRKNNMIDVQHNNRVVPDCAVVESFIARASDDTFVEGAWVVGVYIGDTELWNAILDGTYNGFSLEAFAVLVNKDVLLTFNHSVEGLTSEIDDHRHTFTVYFDDKGNFLGGQTDDTLGHSHTISRGTITDATNGHHHKFDYVEGFGEISELT